MNRKILLIKETSNQPRDRFAGNFLVKKLLAKHFGLSMCSCITVHAHNKIMFFWIFFSRKFCAWGTCVYYSRTYYFCTVLCYTKFIGMWNIPGVQCVWMYVCGLICVCMYVYAFMRVVFFFTVCCYHPLSVWRSGKGVAVWGGRRSEEGPPFSDDWSGRRRNW